MAASRGERASSCEVVNTVGGWKHGTGPRSGFRWARTQSNPNTPLAIRASTAALPNSLRARDASRGESDAKIAEQAAEVYTDVAVAPGGTP